MRRLVRAWDWATLWSCDHGPVVFYGWMITVGLIGAGIWLAVLWYVVTPLLLRVW